MDVLVTGGSGTVGSAILEGLADHEAYSFTNLDLEGVDDPAVETAVADLRYYDEIRPHFDGVDAVIHLGYAPNERQRRAEQAVVWSYAHAMSMHMTANVYRAAIDAGLDSVVYASSNHAVGMYEDRHAPELYEPDYDLLVDHTVQPHPDSMYGTMKVYGESLGRMAAEYHDVGCYAWRICNVTDAERDTPGDYAAHLRERGIDPESDEYRERIARKKAMWFSRRDVAHMVECFLEDESVDFDVFYGVSDNEARWFDIEHAREVLGYDPADDGSAWDVP